MTKEPLRATSGLWLNLLLQRRRGQLPSPARAGAGQTFRDSPKIPWHFLLRVPGADHPLTRAAVAACIPAIAARVTVTPVMAYTELSASHLPPCDAYA